MTVPAIPHPLYELLHGRAPKCPCGDDLVFEEPLIVRNPFMVSSSPTTVRCDRCGTQQVLITPSQDMNHPDFRVGHRIPYTDLTTPPTVCPWDGTPLSYSMISSLEEVPGSGGTVTRQGPWVPHVIRCPWCGASGIRPEPASRT